MLHRRPKSTFDGGGGGSRGAGGGGGSRGAGGGGGQGPGCWGTRPLQNISCAVDTRAITTLHSEPLSRWTVGKKLAPTALNDASNPEASKTCRRKRFNFPLPPNVTTVVPRSAFVHMGHTTKLMWPPKLCGGLKSRGGVGGEG